MVGTDYRHRPVPETNPLLEEEIRTAARFNDILNQYNAEILRPFFATADKLGIHTIRADVHLLRREDGSFAIHAERTESSVFTGLFSRLFQ